MSRSGTEWEWVGQPLAVDLANTVVETKPGVYRDLLVTREQFAGWLVAQGDRVGAPDGLTESLADFRALRDSIRKLFFAVVGGNRLPQSAVAVVNAASGAAPKYAQLDTSDRSHPKAVSFSATEQRPSALLAEVARSAIEIVGGADRSRLRVCGAPSCGMFFLGTGPRQTWCSKACGNRARVARHYARRLRA
jgi:predicted RNA-binding Zn ribbon-like protein